jgi:hypothetical protein
VAPIQSSSIVVVAAPSAAQTGEIKVTPKMRVEVVDVNVFQLHTRIIGGTVISLVFGRHTNKLTVAERTVNLIAHREQHGTVDSSVDRADASLAAVAKVLLGRGNRREGR